MDEYIHFIAKFNVNAANILKYKEILQYFRNEKNLVAYDHIRILGEYAGFHIVSDQNADDYCGAVYRFKDESETHFNIAIGDKRSKQPTASPQKVVYITQIPDRSDLRYCNPHISGVLTIGNIQYTYREGKLLDAYWEQGLYGYALSLLEDRSAPLRGFASRLLNTDTAISATKVLHTAVELGAVSRQTRSLRIILQWVMVTLFLLWGILQRKKVPMFCKKGLLIEDDEQRSNYLRDCYKLKLLVAAVFAIMALVEFCEPVFYSLFLLLYGILLGLAYWLQRLINKEAFAEITDSSVQCTSE